MPQPSPPGTLADYWIGDFDFVTMSRIPEAAKQQPVPEVRPGTHGHALWLTGVRGRPTQIMTFRDTLNIDDSTLAYANYVAAIGTTVSVMYAGRPFNTLFDIMDVSTPDEGVRNTAVGVGGRLGLSSSGVTAVWTLMAVYPFNQNP